MAEIKVKKRNGSLQEFDRNKIESSIAKAGGTPEGAGKISVEVENWVSGAAVDGVISSLQIREKVLELLRVANPEVAKTFEEYRKPTG